MMEWEILFMVTCLALIAVWGVAEIIARNREIEDDRTAHWKRIIERNAKEQQWGKR